jgi:hypothetical protein
MLNYRKPAIGVNAEWREEKEILQRFSFATPGRRGLLSVAPSAHKSTYLRRLPKTGSKASGKPSLIATSAMKRPWTFADWDEDSGAETVLPGNSNRQREKWRRWTEAI